MVKKKSNLSTSPTKKNTTNILRGILFPFILIIKLFIYFFEGIKTIILLPFYIIKLVFKKKPLKDQSKIYERKKIDISTTIKKNTNNNSNKKTKKSFIRRLFFGKSKNTKFDFSAAGIKTEKELLKESKFLKKEKERLLKEKKKNRIKETLAIKQKEKAKQIEIKRRQKANKKELKNRKYEERRKKLEVKIRARAEKQRQKEIALIAKIDKENKLSLEKLEELKNKKSNAIKLKQAQLESKQKKKSEEKIPFKEKVINWYKNLSFIKYRNNKAEMERQVMLINFEGEDALRSDQKIYYKYTAKKKETGEIEKGVFPAFSKLDVHSFLLAEGYEVYEISPQRKYGQGFFVRMGKGKMKTADLVFFLTQLSTFLKSGLPLLDAIKILEKQTKSKKYKNLYKSLAYELTMGENFSDSIEKQGESFPKLLVNMIRSSELSGNLPEILDDMATYYDEINKTRKQMKSAMTYPLVIFVFATLVIVFILIFVIPEFVGIYEEMDAELPKVTSVIIGVSAFLQKNIFYLIASIIIVIVLFQRLFKTVKVFRTLIQWIMMHAPVFGNIMIYNEVTIFTKTFGSLLNHNVFITDSMEVLSRITSNEIYKMLIFDTITNLAKGSPISNAFKNQWAFPIIAYEMLLTGEKTGELGNMMIKVSNYYQLQHKNSVNQIKTFIEPLMIVFLTVMVGIILMSVVLPMFSMYTEIM